MISSPRETIANGRTELSGGQLDFIGRLEVEKGQTMTLTMRVEGTDAIDFALLSEESARPYLDHHLTVPGTAKAQIVPSFQARATRDAPTRAQVLLPEGHYYLLLDHSTAWGETTPPENALPARVDYLIQLGREK